MLLGDRIAPVDLQGGVDQHDALGKCADRPPEALLVFKQPALVLPGRAVRPIQPRKHICPDAPAIGNVFQPRLFEPLCKQDCVTQMNQQHDGQAKHQPPTNPPEG